MSAIKVLDDSGPLRQAWRTPRPLFDALHARFRFDVDGAADDDNHLLPLYWTERSDGLVQLAQSLNDHMRVWLNPPYNDIAPWTAALRARCARGGFAVALLPSRTDQAWFLDALAAEVWFSRGRVRFVPPPGVKSSSNSGGSLLAVFDPESFGRGFVRVFDAKTGALL